MEYLSYLQLGWTIKVQTVSIKKDKNEAVTSKLPDNLFLAAWLLAMGEKEFMPRNRITVFSVGIFAQHC